MAKTRRKMSKSFELKGLCPYCLGGIEVHMDCKNRPYWRCWRCEIRSFGTKTALNRLRLEKWIVKKSQPLRSFRKSR